MDSEYEPVENELGLCYDAKGRVLVRHKISGQCFYAEVVATLSSDSTSTSLVLTKSSIEQQVEDPILPPEQIVENEDDDHTGGVKYKSKIKQWEAIASKMKEKGYKYNGTQCRSRLNTLERGYKRVLDNTKKTGRNRVKLKVSDEVKRKLDDLLAKKDSIALPVILDNHYEERGTHIEGQMEREQQGEDPAEDPDEPAITTVSEGNSPAPLTEGSSPSPVYHEGRRGTPTSRKPTLAGEVAKLRQQQMEHHQQKMEKFNEYVTETKRSNDLFQEYNSILKAMLEK